MTRIAISGTGFFVPPDVVSNCERVKSFNEYARRRHLYARDIVVGHMSAILKSSDEFIVKASKIQCPCGVPGNGMFGVEIVCSRTPERPNDALSLMDEMAMTAECEALVAAHHTSHVADAVFIAPSAVAFGPTST